jgi:hypothetical protein
MSYRPVLNSPFNHFAGRWVLADLTRAIHHTIDNNALGEEWRRWGSSIAADGLFCGGHFGRNAMKWLRRFLIICWSKQRLMKRS